MAVQPAFLLRPFHASRWKWVNGSGPTNPEHYPADMKVDWVRVYKRKKADEQASNKPDAGNGG